MQITTMRYAQSLLYEITELRIHELFDETVTAEEIKANIKLTKRKLRNIKKNLREEQTKVKQTWDARRGVYEKTMQSNELKPLGLIDNLIELINIDILALENSIKFNNPVPSFQKYGEIIYQEDSNISIIELSAALEAADIRNNKDEANLVQQYKNSIQTLKQLDAELEVTTGWFSRGKRDNLEREIRHLEQEIAIKKHGILTIKLLRSLQIAFDFPFTLSFFYADSMQIIGSTANLEETNKLYERIKTTESCLDRINDFIQRHSPLLDNFTDTINSMTRTIKESITKLESILNEQKTDN